MKLNDAEKLEVQNLMKLIRRASFDDFLGTEALALARAYAWLDSLLKQVPQVTEQPILETPAKKNKK